ncbi:MAG: helix-turn-helix domain-containing protein [Actinomycetota bacterium]
MDLEELLRRQESKTLEFKRDLSSPNPIVKTIVAFANTSGGLLVIGVDDETRDVVGMPDPLGDEERLANLIADRIEPPIVPDIEILAWRSTNVLVARIADSSLRPHRVKSEGPHGGVYVRVGSTSRQAGPELIRELDRYSRRGSFDEEPYPAASSEDIDFRAASESFRGIRVLKRPDLKTLRVLTTYQGRTVPTVGGMLLFGTDRLGSFPDAWVKIGSFGGRDRSRILDSKEITSYLPMAVEEAMVQIARMTATAIEIHGARHVPRPAYPATALREAVTNAVVHADYSQHGTPITISLFTDRIEVQNPGLLPFGLTLEDIREGTSKLRNRVIGRVFKELRLIEQWGSGIQRMTEACRDAGLAAPLLEERAMGFRVTILAAPEGPARISALDAGVLEVLERHAGGGGASTSEVARAIGRSDRATRTRLKTLLDRGLVVRVGSSRTDPGARWLPSKP